MKPMEIWIPDATPVMTRAAGNLRSRGIAVVQKATPGTTHLLLSVPCSVNLPEKIPEEIAVLGGNLPAGAFPGHRVTDLLQDPQYLYDNAAITAQCAICLASQGLPRVWAGCQVLVLGWGRIGKFLCKYLCALGASVSAAARNPGDRALIRALGLQALAPENVPAFARRYRVIFNTIPAPVLPEDADRREDAVLVDLASRPGMAGPGVISARGLPGKMAPESAGSLIARSALRLIHGEEVLL